MKRSQGSVTGPAGLVKIYFNCDYDEYSCVLAGRPASEYFASDVSDVMGTARVMAGLPARDDQNMAVVIADMQGY